MSVFVVLSAFLCNAEASPSVILSAAKNLLAERFIVEEEGSYLEPVGNSVCFTTHF